MRIDTRVWIHKEDLKELDLGDAIKIYDLFTGRWQYCMTDRFVLEESPNKITLKELKEIITFNSDVKQESRDIVKRLGELRLIFQMDCEEEEFDDYFELSWFMNKYWEGAKEVIV